MARSTGKNKQAVIGGVCYSWQTSRKVAETVYNGVREELYYKKQSGVYFLVSYNPDTEDYTYCKEYRVGNIQLHNGLFKCFPLLTPEKLKRYCAQRKIELAPERIYFSCTPLKETVIKIKNLADE